MQVLAKLCEILASIQLTPLNLSKFLFCPDCQKRSVREVSTCPLTTAHKYLKTKFKFFDFCILLYTLSVSQG